MPHRVTTHATPNPSATSSADRMRLLPWTGAAGQPCYLSGDGNGLIAHLADDVEATQLGLAGEVMAEARRVLADRSWTPGELHLLAAQLNESLTRVHRIAVSRGARLPSPVAAEDLDAPAGEDDEP